MRVSLRDVAKQAGVSPITASRALRNLSNVSPETVSRVKQAALDLGYVPDPALTALAAHRTGKMPRKTDVANIALIRPESFSDLAAQRSHEMSNDGAKEEAQKLGYKIEEFALGLNAKEQARTQEILLARGVRGILFAPGIIRQKLHLDPARFSCVLINHSIRGTGLHAVRNDLYQMTLLAIKELLNRGSKKIVFYGGTVSEGPSDFRTVAAASQAHLVFPQHNFSAHPFVGSPDEFISYCIAEKPDAVLSMRGKKEWPILAQAGLVPGKSVRYVAINVHPSDTDFASVVADQATLGRIALRQLHNMLLSGERGVPEIRQITRIDGQLVYGSSLELE